MLVSVTSEVLEGLRLTHVADEVGHGGTTSCIAASKESRNIGRICDTLNSELACASNTTSNLIEEQRADGGSVANIALLTGSTGVDHADGAASGAISKLVVAAAAVLAL